MKTEMGKYSLGALFVFPTAHLTLVLENPRQIRATVATEVNQASVTLRSGEVCFCSVSGKASGSVLI